VGARGKSLCPSGRFKNACARTVAPWSPIGFPNPVGLYYAVQQQGVYTIQHLAPGELFRDECSAAGASPFRPTSRRSFSPPRRWKAPS
jgi:hypothetical protein